MHSASVASRSSTGVEPVTEAQKKTGRTAVPAGTTPEADAALALLLRTETMPRLFWARCAERGSKIAIRHKLRGVQRAVSWQAYGQQAKLTGLGFVGLGLKPQDVVSIIAEGCPEWLFSDFGVQGVGGICNGVYTTSSASQVAHILMDSRSVICVVENRKQLDKVLAVREQCPLLRRIVVIDMLGLEGLNDPMVISFDDLLAAGRQVDQEDPARWPAALAAGQPQDIGILVYTSGTTGNPKGAMLSQANLLFLMGTEPLVMPQDAEDELLNFLPLCHTAGRLLSAIFPIRSACTVTFVERLDTLASEMREVQPTLFFAPPRLWAKMHGGIEASMKNAPFLKRLAYRLAFAVGHRKARYAVAGNPVPWWLNAGYAVADRLVLGKIKRDLGLARCRSPLTGAAPITPEVVDWYVALGIELREAYGQTEGSGLISTTPVGSYKFGTAGLPLPHTEVELDAQGEILVRGPNVFQGYLNQPEKSRETVVDGWLKTGDVGRFDAQGWLYITDRLKDIIITDGGKNISPSEIENKLKASPYIADAVVIGDRRKFISCLVIIDYESVAQYGRDLGVVFSDFASLSRAPEVQDLIGRKVAEVNLQLSQVESIKKFRLIERPPTIEEGDLTATGKLKRAMVSAKYASLIGEMYQAD